MAHMEIRSTKRQLEDDFASVAHPPPKRARTLSTPVKPAPLAEGLPRHDPARDYGYHAHRQGAKPARRSARQEENSSDEDSARDSDSTDVQAVSRALRTVALQENEIRKKVPARAPDSDSSDDVEVVTRPKAKDARIRLDAIFPKIKEEPKQVTITQRHVDDLIDAKRLTDAAIETLIEDLSALRYVVSRLDPESPNGRIFGLSARKSYNVISETLTTVRHAFIKVHDAAVDFQFKQRARYSLEGLNLHATPRLATKD